MASRLTVVFYIILCLEAGVFLTVLPWVGGGSYWGENYFLVIAAQKIGSVGLQRAVASGWVRGAVTGLGLLNLAMAFWEIFHFGDTVRRLRAADGARPVAQANEPARLNNVTPFPTTQAQSADAARATEADNVSNHGRGGE